MDNLLLHRFRSRSRLDGPPTALPRPLDVLSERWFRLGPRWRLGLTALLVVGAVVAYAVRMSSSPWGPPVDVLVAASDLALGQELGVEDVQTTRWPAGLVPDDAITEPVGGRLTAAVPAGTVVTARHLASAGVAAALPADTAGVAVPRDLLPEVPAGARVDLVGADLDGSGTVLAADVAVLRIDDARVWLAVPRARAPEVAGAAAAGALTAVLLPL